MTEKKPKVTAKRLLAELLEKNIGHSVSTELIAMYLEIGKLSVPQYIHELRKNYKADIKKTKAGYTLKSADILKKVPKYRKNNAIGQPTTELIPTQSQGFYEAGDDRVEWSDGELGDLKNSLGIAGFGGL